MKYGVCALLVVCNVQSVAMESDECRLDVLVRNAVTAVRENYVPLQEDDGCKNRNQSVIDGSLEKQFKKQLKDNGQDEALLPLMKQALKKIYENTAMEITMINQSPITAVDVTPDGNRILVGDKKGHLALWSGGSCWGEDCNEQHNAAITAVCFAPNNRAVSADKNGYVHIRTYNCWDFEDKKKFKLDNGFYADMIAMNDQITQCVCAHKETKTVMVYGQEGGKWALHSFIPLFKSMIPSTLGWKDQLVIAFGEGPEKEDFAISEWKEFDGKWLRLDYYPVDAASEDDFAGLKYGLTRREALYATDLRRTIGVICEGTIMRIIDNEPGYKEIIEFFVREWKKEKEKTLASDQGVDLTSLTPLSDS